MIDDAEYRRLQQVAKRKQMTISEWARHALRVAAAEEPTGSGDKKLAVIRAAARRAAPTADIEQMLAEIESGYVPKASR